MIKRDLYMKKIRPFMNKDVVKVLTGIRRSGKSVMLQLIQDELIESGVDKKRMLAINFESNSVDYVKSVDETYSVIKKLAKDNSGTIYLFLDEVQELNGWESMVNSCMVDFDIDIYITGSNAKMLSGELATYLAGRYIEIRMYPFSFSEVCDILPDNSPKDNFMTYIVRGGMPFIYQNEMDDYNVKQYLDDIYSSIVLKDVVQRNNVRDIELFKRIVLYMISGVGHTLSSTNITKYLKSQGRHISTETIYNYIEYCKAACLFHMVSREDVVGKKLLQFQEKMYMTDHGLREAIYGNNMRDIDQILENIIYIELLRRGYNVNVGKVNRSEVDFVVTKAAERYYIQVSYMLAGEETVEREFQPLERIADNYPKYVITMDDIDRSRNGIVHVNIIDFLLRDDLFER